jgi:hypothetical protein
VSWEDSGTAPEEDTALSWLLKCQDVAQSHDLQRSKRFGKATCDIMRVVFPEAYPDLVHDDSVPDTKLQWFALALNACQCDETRVVRSMLFQVDVEQR